MSESDSSERESRRRAWEQGSRFLPFVFFLFVIIMLFFGGVAAVLYLLFTEYTGTRNIWILVCCLPVSVLALALWVISSLYTRYGRPLGQIFGAIDSVSEGDLSVRVPDDSSPQFGELIKRFNKMVEELERADKQRRDLTADIAHELRTPLHIIQGKLEGIQDGVYEASPQQVGEALEETRLLARLVDDLQTLSLAESSQLPLNKSRFTLSSLFQDVIASFSARAAAGGVQLTALNPQSDLQINADYQRLGQVLTNLASNALRYTAAGGSVTFEARAESAGWVTLHVRDAGSGIPADDLPFIFDRFWRGDKARSREGHANSGLGLAISRQLVLAHGGSITAQSEVGKGTEFVIRLPAG
jgi:two-component system OmpR family sensor kinase/two-component system sensor histidine kinase BaeS